MKNNESKEEYLLKIMFWGMVIFTLFNVFFLDNE